MTGAIFTKFGRVPTTWTRRVKPQVPVEEVELVRDGALEGLAAVDVEVAEARVGDELALRRAQRPPRSPARAA